MPHLARRPWVPAACETLIQRQAGETAAPSAEVAARIEALIDRNRRSTSATASTSTRPPT